MPRKPGNVPAYSHHRSSGQAIVRISGRDHYLGPHDSPESREKYDRLIAEWLSNGRQPVIQIPNENRARQTSEVFETSEVLAGVAAQIFLAIRLIRQAA